MDNILKTVEQFCTDHKMGWSTFGAKSVGDPNLIKQLRAGRELRSKTREKIEKFMIELAAGHALTGETQILRSPNVQNDPLAGHGERNAA
jgi:hypothetical protein